MARKRCVFKLRGGAGCVFSSVQPRPGGGNCWVFAGPNALDGDCLWVGDPVGAGVADAKCWDSGGAGGVVCSADDGADGDFAGGGESEDGNVAGQDRVDRGNRGRKSLVGGVYAAAYGFGWVGEWRVVSRHSGDVVHGQGSGRSAVDCSGLVAQTPFCALCTHPLRSCRFTIWQDSFVGERAHIWRCSIGSRRAKVVPLKDACATGSPSSHCFCVRQSKIPPTDATNR